MLVIVSAPSGSGKTSLMRLAMGREAEIVSFTTRPMRAGEVDKQDYIFIDKEHVKRLEMDDRVIEKTVYPPDDSNGNIYGVTKDEIEEKLIRGDAFIIVDANGMRQIKKLYPKAFTVWIQANKYQCETNMKNRGDRLEDVHKRLETYEVEVLDKEEYECIINNYQNCIENVVRDIQLAIKSAQKKYINH